MEYGEDNYRLMVCVKTSFTFIPSGSPGLGDISKTKLRWETQEERLYSSQGAAPSARFILLPRAGVSNCGVKLTFHSGPYADVSVGGYLRKWEPVPKMWSPWSPENCQGLLQGILKILTHFVPFSATVGHFSVRVHAF